MEIPTIQAESRKAAGSRAAVRLRKGGKLPAVLYGQKQDPMSIMIDHHRMAQHMSHGAHLLNLDINGKLQPCLIKDAQYDHLGSTLMHVDLTRVNLSDKVKVHVTLELRGTPKGAAEGGVVRQDLQELEVECLVTGIPERIRIDISDLALDEVRYVKDLKLDAGLKCTNDPDTVVMTCRVPIEKAATDATAVPVEGAAEPEVIAKGKIEEEGAEAAAEKPEKKEKEKK
jgi:large subunit ribosomal protein L25